MRGSDVSGNPDGWGVAYLADADAQLIRESTPAATSPYVAFLESYGPASKLIISHVRRATAGDRSLVNTQPFSRILSGRVHVFAHNGYVPLPEPNYRSPWLKPVGETDSEKLFCKLLHGLAPLWQESVFPSIEDRTEVVLRRLDPGVPHPYGHLWILTHGDLRQSQRVRVFTEFIASA